MSTVLPVEILSGCKQGVGESFGNGLVCLCWDFSHMISSHRGCSVCEEKSQELCSRVLLK